MKKKLLVVILCIAMVTSMLTACGSKSKDKGVSKQNDVTRDEQGKVDTSGAADESVKIDELTLPLTDTKEEISVWIVWEHNFLDSLEEVAGIKKMEELTNVKVNYTCVTSAEAVEKYNLLLTSGDLPDVVYSAYGYPGGGDKSIEDDVFLDMTYYVENFMPNYRKLRLSTDLTRKMTVTDTGKMWAINMLRCTDDGQVAEEETWAGMVIRKDWLDDLGLDVPVTIDDWHTTLKEFKEKKGAEAPLLLGSTGSYYSDAPFYSAYGVLSNYYLDGDTVKYGPMEEGYRQTLDTLRQWYSEGLIDTNFISNSHDIVSSNDYMATGKSGAGMNMWGTGIADYHKAYGFTEDENIFFVPVQNPVLKEGDTAQGRLRAGTEIVSTSFSVSAKCKNPELVAKWLDFQYTKEGMLLNSYGVEGLSYTVEGDKYKVTDLVTKDENGLSAVDAFKMYHRGDGPGLVSWNRWEECFDSKYTSAKKTWHKDGTSLVLPGVTMTDEEGSIYNNLNTAVDTYVKEYRVNYILGQTTEDWDSYVEALKGMGVLQCLSIYQDAYDRFDKR